MMCSFDAFWLRIEFFVVCFMCLQGVFERCVCKVCVQGVFERCVCVSFYFFS